MSIELVDQVQEQLSTARFGRAMRGYEEVGSTNTEAADWARDGASEGSVVAAEFQTQGRGRHGRTWAADSGTNLTFSTVLRPRLSADRLGLVTLAAGVAVASAVEAFIGPHRASIKWPNDVLLEGRKTCGMLLEGSFSGRRTPSSTSSAAPDFVILGIGLNVNQTDFPEDLADRATSLKLVAGRSVPRPPLLARLLHELEEHYDALLHGDAARIRDAFRERMDRLDESVTLRFTGSDRTVSGIARGVSSDGGLRLDTGSSETVVHAGEVTSR